MAQIQSNETIRQTIQGFDGVWRRVTGDTQPATAAASSSGDETLQRLIRDEQCTATFNTCLARMLRGPARAVLFSQANEAMCRMRRLRAEYFIKTGDKCVPQEECAPTEGCLCSLRTAYERALSTEEAYERAADCAGSEELKELYRCFGEEARRSARTLRCLIVNSF